MKIENGIQRLLNDNGPSAELLENTVQRMKEEQWASFKDTAQPVHGGGRRRLLAVGLAAALVLTLTVGAGATGVFGGISRLFATVFPGSERNIHWLEMNATPIGVSAEKDGVTVTAEAVIGDKNQCVVLYSVKKDGIDGKYSIMGQVERDYVDGDWTGAWYMYDGYPDDGIQQFYEVWDRVPTEDGKATTGDYKITMGDLKLWSEETETYETVAKGPWVLEFQADIPDSTVELPAGQTYVSENNGETFTVDSIEISPLSITVTSSTDAPGVDLSAPIGTAENDEAQRLLDFPTMTITKTDGDVIFVNSYYHDGEPLSEGDKNVSLKAHVEDGRLICKNSAMFRRVLPFDEIESITIEGVEVYHAE